MFTTTYIFMVIILHLSSDTLLIFTPGHIKLKVYRTHGKLDLMFMKHYAPNRCLYIKVAKLRTVVGSAETSYLQNYSVKLFKEHFKVQICKGGLYEKFSPINFLIILYQLTKFEAPSCYSFRDIMITNFQSLNLQREIIRNK